MKCKKCGSENVNVQVVAETKKQHHSILYWLCIGWWLKPLLWLFLTLPMIIVKLFGKDKTKTVEKSFAVCQDCGYRWQV